MENKKKRMLIVCSLILVLLIGFVILLSIFFKPSALRYTVIYDFPFLVENGLAAVDPASESAYETYLAEKGTDRLDNTVFFDVKTDGTVIIMRGIVRADYDLGKTPFLVFPNRIRIVKLENSSLQSLIALCEMIGHKKIKPDLIELANPYEDSDSVRLFVPDEHLYYNGSIIRTTNFYGDIESNKAKEEMRSIPAAIIRGLDEHFFLKLTCHPEQNTFLDYQRIFQPDLFYYFEPDVPWYQKLWDAFL